MSENKNKLFFILNLVLTILIFILDTALPFNYPYRIPLWLLYFIPVILVSWNIATVYTYSLASLSSVFIFLSVLIPPKGNSPFGLLITNRIIGTLIIWVLVYFVVQRKRMLESMQQTTGLLETIFANIHTLYVYVNRDLKIERVNKSFSEINNRNEDFFSGKNIFEVFPNSKYRQKISEVLKTGIPHFEIAYLLPAELGLKKLEEKTSNEETYWDIGIVPVKNSFGKVIGIIMSFSDVTQRIKIEQAFRENQVRLNGIISSAMDAIISLDSNQKVILFNSAAEKMFKIKAELAIGRHINTFIPDRYKNVHEEHVKSFSKTNVSMRSMGRLGSVVGLRSDGIEFPIEASISQVDTGREKIFSVILRDITQRRQIEEQIKNQKYRAEILVSISKELSEVTLDFDTVSDLVTKRLCELMGGSCLIWELDEERKFLKFNTSCNNDPEQSEELKQLLTSSTFQIAGSIYSKVLDAGYPLFFPEIPDEVIKGYIKNKENIGKFKSFKFHSLLIIPLKAQKNLVGILEIIKQEKESILSIEDKALIQDIADRAALTMINAKNHAEKLHEIETRKVVEENLLKIKEELERSNSELEQFAYVASHDLQEPLRMIASYVQLLSVRYKDKLDENANEFINFAVDGATRMQRLINDLLSYSRVSSRNKEFKPTDLNEVLDLALTNLKLIIEENDAIIHRDELPKVVADPTQMEQLFQNLIGNAVKFKGEKKPEINIGKEIVDGNWLISIKDNGIGMEEKYKDLIFVIFQRLHQNTYPGTGIGLAVCKKIVERHGGKIWVESESGKGSTFYFTIPRKGI